METPGLVFFVRYVASRDHVAIESDVATADVSVLPGFIKILPQVKSTDDVTPGLLRGLLDECDFWPLTDDAKAKFRKDAAEWIAKKR